MKAVAGVEGRHLVRSPLLWLGVALAVALTALEMSWFLPALAGDDLLAYTAGGLPLGGGALLAGAWLGLRDRVSGAADLVAVTPTAPWRLWRARLVGVAAAAASVFAVAFAAALAVSAVRGGRGTPDLRLLADGALAVVLGGWVGVAVGRLSGSRMVSVLAAPVWLVLGFFVVTGGLGVPGRSLSVQNLAPVLNPQGHSAAYGLLPDPLWPHLGYLLGLILLVGALLLVLVSRGSGQRMPLRPLLVVAVAGLVLAATGATRLLTLPDVLLVLGPDRATWKPVQSDVYSPEAVSVDPGWSFPADDHARACAGDARLSVCVYPAYGQRLARQMHAAMAPVASVFTGLPGVPTRVRMVPVGNGSCRGTEVQVPEGPVREPAGGSDRNTRQFFVGFYLQCALGLSSVPDDHPVGDARDAVSLWALVASGTMPRQALTGGEESDPQWAPVEHAALAMAELPTAQVRAELAPRWERLRAGRLPLSELPGQRS
jgi:hypothetical protein